MVFFKDRDALKFINHCQKIIGLPQPNEQRFQDVTQLSWQRDLCKIGNVTVNHGMGR